jgi:hypothetical protein
MDIGGKAIAQLLSGVNPENGGERFDINKVMQGVQGIDASKFHLLPNGIDSYAAQHLLGIPDTPEGRAQAALISSVESYTRSAAGVHGFRSVNAPLRSAKDLLNDFMNSPGAAKNYLAAQDAAKEQLHTMYKSQLHYGTLIRPDEQYIQQGAAKERAARNAFLQAQKTGQPPPGAPDAGTLALAGLGGGGNTGGGGGQTVDIPYIGDDGKPYKLTVAAEKAEQARALIAQKQQQKQQTQTQTPPSAGDQLRNMAVGFANQLFTPSSQ